MNAWLGIVAALLITAICSRGVAQSGQNFVTNPDFDSSISGWTQSDSVTELSSCSWSADVGFPNPGSAHCVGLAPFGGVSFTQCVAVSAERFDVIVYARTVSPNYFFVQTLDDCAQGSPAFFEMHDEGPYDSSSDLAWHRYALRFAPRDAGYANIGLGAGAGGDVFLDHIYVGPSETVFTSRFECDTDTYFDCD